MPLGPERGPKQPGIIPYLTGSKCSGCFESYSESHSLCHRDRAPGPGPVEPGLPLASATGPTVAWSLDYPIDIPRPNPDAPRC